MKVRDVMTTRVVTVAPETAFKEVIERLVHAEVSGLPVLDGNGRLVGMVTEADVMPKGAYVTRRHRALALLGDLLSVRDHRWVEKAAGSSAAEVMTREVLACGGRSALVGTVGPVPHSTGGDRHQSRRRGWR